MPNLDKLFSAMAEAVAANDQNRFDALERDLLGHFEGSFSGMPREIYDRYLEIDRGWPAAVPSGFFASSGTNGRKFLDAIHELSFSPYFRLVTSPLHSGLGCGFTPVMFLCVIAFHVIWS